MAAQLMVEAFPKQVEAIYVHEVQERCKTYKYDPEAWKTKPVKPIFFKTYIEIALYAATRTAPLLRISGLRRICIDAINDFYMIQTNQWRSQQQKWDRHDEINQSLFYCNNFLQTINEDTVPLLEAKRLWKDGQKIRCPFGTGKIVTFHPISDMYEVELDWRPLDVQVTEYKKNELLEMQKTSSSMSPPPSKSTDARSQPLETVFEADEEMSQTKLPKVSSDISCDMEESIHELAHKNSNIDSGKKTPDLTLSSDMESDSSGMLCRKQRVVATIQCRHILKYSPPTLPSFPSEDGSKSTFSFWGSRTEGTKSKALFNKDDKCNTPYGCGTVVDYRENTGIVVISMSNWNGTCYLNAESVKIVSDGFFNRMLRIISIDSKTSKSSLQKEVQPPFAMDSIVSTPFGEGRVIRPLERIGEDGVSLDQGKKHPVSNISDSADRFSSPNTIAISLSSWMLANDSHPVLYCTSETALSWKGMCDEEERSKSSGGILSAFGSIVSQSVKNLIVGKPKKKTIEIPTEIVVPAFERFYEDGAAVVTPFGNGVVSAFREIDGMYTVTLNHWKMANNACPKIFLMKDLLSCQIAAGCIEGYPVLTSLGISGILVSIQPKTGIHIVAREVGQQAMVCYLQPKDVLRPLKAAVNEDVLTPYGNGKVVNFRVKDDMYEILLCWGSKLFARAESFDRDYSGNEEKGGFGIDWVIRLFYTLDRNNSRRGAGGSERTRSRSNSVASARTHTSRSLL